MQKGILILKASDIVNQLAVLLPAKSDKFTDNFNITSLTRSGTTVTATTGTAHGKAIGDQVNVVGALTPLTIASLTRAGEIGTLVTDNNHDMTEGFSIDVELVGSTEAEFNGTFVVLTVPNRKTVTFTTVDTGPTVATGSPLLNNGSSALQQYNGLHNIDTVPSTTTFTYEIIDTTLFSPAAGTISARAAPRISAAVTNEAALQAYTVQTDDNLCAFVVLGDVTASKSRKIDSDANDNIQRSNNYRQQLIYPFTVFVFFPSSTQIAGRKARDDAEDIFLPLCQSLLGSSLDSGLFAGAQNPINFVDHGTADYKSAYYVHAYNFATVADLTFDDTIGYDEDVAFRDIVTGMTINIGTEEDALTANIDLDDVII
jgi:hypothetical protein